MKMIDEKGNIFGRMNAVDFLVVVFLLCILPAFYFGYRIMNTSKQYVESKARQANVEVKCRLTGLSPEQSKLVSVGDREWGRDGLIIAEIVKLNKKTEAGDIEVRLRLQGRIHGTEIYYKDQPITTGSVLHFDAVKYRSNALVLDTARIVEDRIVTVPVLLKGLDDSLINEIDVGDRELDASGSVIAEIVKIGKAGKNLTRVGLDRSASILVEDRNKKQVYIQLRVKCQEKPNQELYFKDEELCYNIPIIFQTDKYKVRGWLTDVFEENLEQERVIDLHVTIKDLEEETIKKLEVGDKELDAKGRVLAEILSIGTVKNNVIEVDLGGGNFLMGEEKAKKEVSTKMRLRCKVKQDSRQIYFKGEQIRQNVPFEFKTAKYTVEAFPSKTFSKQKEISLQVKFSGISPEIARIIQKGDIEINPFGEVAAKVIAIVSNKPSHVLVMKEKEFVPVEHPFYKDILINLMVRCAGKDGTFYFKNYPIKIGNSITLSTELYSISGTIIKMEI